MRHRVYGKHLSRDKNQRTALLRGLVRSLILHESITTTDTKAKAIKGLVDRLITQAKKQTNSSNNEIISTLPQKEISQKLITEIAPRFSSRISGFTNVVRLGTRSGDGAMMVKMSLVEEKISDSREPRGKNIESSKQSLPSNDDKIKSLKVRSHSSSGTLRPTVLKAKKEKSVNK